MSADKQVTPLNAVSQIMKDAKDEVQAEITSKYKREVKFKLKALATAKKVVKNLGDELDDLAICIGKELE
jgi:hypothetical protein